MQQQKENASSNYYSVSPIFIPQDLYESIDKKFDAANKDEWMTHELAEKVCKIIADPHFFKTYVEANKQELEALGYINKSVIDLADEKNPLNYDLSTLSQEEKSKITSGALQTAAHMLLKTFYSLGLKTHMAVKVQNDTGATTEEFVLTFIKFGDGQK